MNNRLLLGVSLVLILIGVILIGDWQAIGHDPCLQSETSTVNGTYSGYNSSDLNDFSNHFSTLSATETDSIENCSLSSFRQVSCESWSTSSHQCFWNQKSRITGEFCGTCHEVCLSEQKSMNFYQFCIGVLLISVTLPVGFVAIPAILSDITSVESQVLLACMVHIVVMQC